MNVDEICGEMCKEIGEVLKNQRIALGLSIKEISRKSGVCRTTIYRYENNAANMNIYLLIKICYALDLNLSIKLTPIKE